MSGSQSNRKHEFSREDEQELNDVKLEIKAVKHCLRRTSSDPSSDIFDIIPIYRMMQQERLESMLEKLQDNKNTLLKRKTNMERNNNGLSLGPAKTIYIVVPPLDKDDETTTEIHTMRDQVELDELLSINRVSLFVGNVAYRRFDDLVDGGIYSYGGVMFNADVRKRTSA